MISLFDDQQELIDALRAKMKKKRRVLMVSPTGSGKSVMASAMIAGSQAKGKSAAFVVPRVDLMTQMVGTFSDFGIKHGIVAAGYPFNPYYKTYICSAQSLINRLDKISPDVVLIDESHISGNTVKNIIKHYHDAGSWIVGLTATPRKTCGSGMNDMYDDIVIGKSTAWLIENGRLSKFKYYAPSAPDLTAVKITAGDYNKKQLNAEMMRQATVTGDSVKHYRELAAGKKAVVYNCSIEHSKQTAEAFNAAGIPCKHVDGDTDKGELKKICTEFALGIIQVISSVDLITTGFDLKSQTGIDVNIECVILLRPTKSLALFLQMVGRGLRKKDYPCIILDHAGNVQIHGLPDYEHAWSLEGTKKSNGKKERTPPTKQCPKCFSVHTPAAICPDCGYVYEFQSRKVDFEDGVLKEITKEQAAAMIRNQQAMAKTLDDLIQLGRQRGYKSPEFWAAKIMTARGR
jgi:superfamily II DNA or RNA helicase